MLAPLLNAAPASVSQRQPVQQEAVPCEAVPGPAAQPGLLPHARQDKARAPGDVQPIHKAARWKRTELPEPLNARLALLHCPEPYQAVARPARLCGIDFGFRKRPHSTLTKPHARGRADSPLSCSAPDWPSSTVQRLIQAVTCPTGLQVTSARVPNADLGIVLAKISPGPVRRTCCATHFNSGHRSRLLTSPTRQSGQQPTTQLEENIQCWRAQPEWLGGAAA